MKRTLRWGVVGTLIGILITGVLAQTTAPENLFQLFLSNLRNDLEIVADRTLGAGQRPAGWTGNDVLDSDSILADLFIDNELLADTIFGEGQRPDGWIGATTRNIELVARNIRHDLELAANNQLGEDLRPDDWGGSDELFTCSRTIMNTALILEQEFNLRPQQSQGARDFCITVAREIEDQLISQALASPEEALIQEIPAQVLAVRGDLERIADEVLGVNQRPSGWLDNVDIESPQLAADVASDLELLTNIQLGVNERPPGWVRTPLVSSPIVTFQNLRFNVEVLANTLLGEGVRPRGWQGEDPLLRCNTAIQNLVLLVGQVFDFEIPDMGENEANFCDRVEMQANNLVENPPPPEVVVGPDGEEVVVDEDIRFRAESQLAFAYLDMAAIDYMGVMPQGTQFRAWYRNFGDSTMMFVSGEDFAVFIDRRWTTMPQETFNGLPTIEGVRPLTFCDAAWCNGPSPTPTPTGSGPILEIITNATPPPTLAPTPLPGEDLSQERIVDWTHIRSNQILQRPGVNLVQVTLEICSSPAQVACEPVISVTDNNTGQPVPVISQFNGLNVYELPFGFSTNFTISGANFTSNDIWLNDPSAIGQ